MSFTSKERDLRFRNIKRNMTFEDIDALVVFGNTGIGVPHNGNYTYLTNHRLFYSSALVFFPMNGDPVVLVPGENQLLDARQSTWIEDVRLTLQPYDDLCDIINSTLKHSSKVGISSIASFPTLGFKKLSGQFPDIDFCEGASVIFSSRKTKSEEEKNVLRHCSKIADLGLKRGIEFLKSGVNELQWRAEVEKVMTEQGADGGFNMLGSGQPEEEGDLFRGFVVPPTKRVFRSNDLVLLEISPRVDGYFTQIVRLASLGEPPDFIKEAHEACLCAKQEALNVIKPGINYVEVAEVARSSLDKSGYRMKNIGTAHTIGLDLSEAILNLHNEIEIEEGDLITIHPMIEIGDWQQLFVGETYILNGNGLEALTEFNDQIIIVD